VSSLVGRGPEIAAVLERLRTARVVTLTGPGGCGKTRLALRVAALAEPGFADGARLVELAPLTDPALVPGEALEQVVKETGATANQVVLAWLIGGELPIVPLIGASSVAQLDESLAAVDLELSTEQRRLLDVAD
jgi:aryl-alcohol dehydrogenase-like predicted oxidoreductase